MDKLKYGDRREDGAIFVGWHKRGNKVYPHWMSEEAFLRKRANSLAPGGATHRANQRVKKRKETDPEFRAGVNAKAKQDMSSYRRKYPERSMWMQARSRARKKSLPFDIEVDDIVIPALCPVLGIELQGFVGNFDSSPSLDRIDNSKGYVKGNIAVISLRANRLKRDATIDELRRVLDYYTRAIA